METNLSEILAAIQAGNASTISTLTTTLASKEDLDSLVSKVDSVDSRLDSVENSLVSLGSIMASKADVARVSEDVSTLSGRLDAMDKIMAGDRSTLGAMEADVSSIRLEMAELKGNADKADSNLEGFGQRLHETENRVEALEQSDQQLVAKIVEHLSPNLQTIVDQQVQNTVHRLEVFGAELTAHRIEIAELSSELKAFVSRQDFMEWRRQFASGKTDMRKKEYTFDVQAPNLRARKESLMDSTVNFNRGLFSPCVV